MKSLTATVRGITLTALIAGFSQAAFASDLAQSMCDAYRPVIDNAFSFRSQEIPISSTKDMAGSALDVDPNLYRYLIWAIDWIYSDPAGAKLAYDKGYFQSACVTQVRGY
jgi:hypothetical protein